MENCTNFFNLCINILLLSLNTDEQNNININSNNQGITGLQNNEECEKDILDHTNNILLVLNNTMKKSKKVLISNYFIILLRYLSMACEENRYYFTTTWSYGTYKIIDYVFKKYSDDNVCREIIIFLNLLCLENNHNHHYKIEYDEENVIHHNNQHQNLNANNVFSEDEINDPNLIFTSNEENKTANNIHSIYEDLYDIKNNDISYNIYSNLTFYQNLVNIFSIENFFLLANYQKIFLNEVLVDFFITLYETSFPYSEELIRYVIDSESPFNDSVYLVNVKKIDEELSQMINDANDYYGYTSASVPTEDDDLNNNMQNSSNTKNNNKENLVMKFLYYILYDIVLKIFDELKIFYYTLHPYLNHNKSKSLAKLNPKVLVFYFDILSNILFKYERSFKLISNMYNMLELKTVLLKFFELNFIIISPLKWSLDFISFFDSFINLLKGIEKFWDDIIYNESDIDFININKKLLKIKKNLNFNDVGIVLDERDLKVLKYLTEENDHDHPFHRNDNKDDIKEDDDYFLSTSLTESKIDEQVSYIQNNYQATHISTNNNNPYDLSHPMNVSPTSYSLNLSDDRDPDELQVRIIKHCQHFNEEYEYLESFNYSIPTYEEIHTDDFMEEDDDDFDPHLNISNKANQFPSSPHLVGSINQSTELDYNHYSSPSPSLRQFQRGMTPSPSPSLRTAPSPSIRTSVSMAHFLSSSRSSASLNTLAKSQSSVSLHNQGLANSTHSNSYSNIINHPPSPSPSPCIFAKTSASVPLSEFDDKRARSYVQLAKKLIVSLIGQLSWLENFVQDFYNEVQRDNASSNSQGAPQPSTATRDLMARKILFLYLLANILGFDTLGNVIERCDDLYDILWDILNTNSLNLLSIKGIDKKCIQIITLLHSRNPKNDEFFPERVTKDKEKLNTFKLEYIRWLMQILETRPESINGAICSAATSLKHQYQSSLIFHSNKIEQSAVNSTGIFSLNSNNLKLKMQQSSNVQNFTVSRENLSIHANLFRSLSLLNNKEEDDIDENDEKLSNPLIHRNYKFYLYEKFNLNIDLHNAAIFSLLEFSKECSSSNNDEINKAVLLEIWKIIFALERFLPHDLISLQPILLLIKLLLKSNSRLDITTEASIVIFLIRSLNHNLLYIKYQACELIDFIGKVLPGFIYRAISRYEIEEPLLECFSNILSRLHHENLIANDNKSSKSNSNISSFASIQKQSSRILVSIIKAITTLVHNLNLRPYWCPSPYAYHWSVYKPYISTREVVSPRTVNFMLISLKYADISYRGTFLSHLLSYASSCLYIYSDGIYNPNNYEDKIRIKKLSEALVSSLLPLLPLALDILMLITKKRRRLNLPSKIYYSDVEDDVNSSIGKKNQKLTKKSKLINKILLLNTKNHKKFNNENSSINGIQKKINFSNVNSTNSQGNSANNLLNNSAMSSSSSTNLLNQNQQLSEQFLINLSHYDSIDEVNRSLSIELLREKVFEATLSFFCRDEDFGLKPLTTYRRYAYLFQKQPLIANISMLMLDYFYNHIEFMDIYHPINSNLSFLEKYKKSNHTPINETKPIESSSSNIHSQLKKGLSILSHFIESEFQLSAISMHSPLAFLSVFVAFPDNLDIRQNLVKVILLLVKFGFFVPELNSKSANASPSEPSRKSLGNSIQSTKVEFIVQSDLVDEFGLSNLIRHGLHYGISSNLKLKTYLEETKQNKESSPSLTTNNRLNQPANNSDNKSLANKMLSMVGMKNTSAVQNTSTAPSYLSEQKVERKVLEIIKQSLVSLLCLGSSPQRLACMLFDFDSPSLSLDTLNNNFSNLNLKKEKKKKIPTSNSNSSLSKKGLKNSSSNKSLTSNSSSNNLIFSSINSSPYVSLSMTTSSSSSNIQSLSKVRSLNKSNSLSNLSQSNDLKNSIASPKKNDKLRSTTDLESLNSSLFNNDTNSIRNSQFDEDDSNSQANSDYFFGCDFDEDQPNLVGRLALTENNSEDFMSGSPRVSGKFY